MAPWKCAINTSTFFTLWRAMRNRNLVTSVDGMVAQLVNLVSKGYRYYFVGAIDDPGVSAVSLDSR
jgi:hypothetical protein